jgi:hypothetical protein
VADRAHGRMRDDNEATARERIHLDPANKNILIDKSDRPRVDPIVDGDEEISSATQSGAHLAIRRVRREQAAQPGRQGDLLRERLERTPVGFAPAGKRRIAGRTPNQSPRALAIERLPLYSRKAAT